MYKIYKYTNVITGKVYIGQTSKSLEERAQNNGLNYRGSRRFYEAICDYSRDSFEPEILEEVETAEEANEREIYYIKLFNSTNPEDGYNIGLGGDNHVVSEETRKIISQKAKERYKDPTKNPMYGRKHTEETKQKQRECKLGQLNPMFGRKWTEKQKAGCGTKGKHLNLTDEQRDVLRQRANIMHKSIRKAIRCVSDNMEFASITEASKYYNIPVPTISDNLHGKSKICHGLSFEFI